MRSRRTATRGESSAPFARPNSSASSIMSATSCWYHSACSRSTPSAPICLSASASRPSRASARQRGEPPAAVVLTAPNSDTVPQQVSSGAADLGFVEGPTSPAGLRSRVIGHDELVVVVRPNHPWAQRRQPLSPAELASTRLASREEGSGTRDALTAALSAALGRRVTMPVALALSSTAAVRAAVLAGAGPAVLSELAVAEDLASHRLARVPVGGVNLRRSLRAIWSGGTLPPMGAARDLLAHVTARHTGTPG